MVQAMQGLSKIINILILFFISFFFCSYDLFSRIQ